MSSVIEASGIKYRYSRDWVLDGLSLTIEEGEIAGIIGPNGSGKTTVLKLLSKVLKQESGSVRLMGRDIASMKQKEIAKIIAVVPQGTSIAFPFTVREIVLMGRSPHLGLLQMERESDVKIADNAMALTDTFEFADRSIDELSGGERQRVIVARALAQEPEIMLLDEPTSFLDINHQIEIFDLIKRLNGERGLTVVIVSHDLNMAAEYCDRLILLKNGSVYKDGSPREVITEAYIREVYEANVVVSDNAITGAPHITPVSELMSREYRKHNLKVHLICGGGSGARLMRLLVIEGYEVSAGVLNTGDTDYQLASSLGLDIVEEAPFSHISDEAYQENVRRAQAADVVILSRVTIGVGNLKNIVATQNALVAGRKVIVFEDFDGMDYTDGEATRIFNELSSNGAAVVKDESEALNIIISLDSHEI
ncbi:heme ABC transporter ATP-binding protein [Candidatus Poribacteria bacterium]